MKVLMVSKALMRGAYQRKLEEIASLGVDLTVAVPPYWREGKHRQILERSYEKGYHLLVTPMALNGHYHVHFYPNLANLLRVLRPDVLHMDEEPYNLATYHALRLGHRYGARTVIYTWQNIDRPLPLPFALLERRTLALADGMMAGSRDAADILRRRKSYNGALEVIPQFGIDPDLFRPSMDARGQDHPFTIGFVGRLIAAKGILVLLRALPLLDQNRPGEAPACLEVVGAGELRAEAEDLARQLGVAHRVTFHGEIPSTEMPAMMHRFDVLVGPSLTTPRWKEQFGRMLVEAMACGIPVIGSDSGEIPHVIGSAGIVVPEGDSTALANALARLAASPSECAALGQAGRQRTLSLYTQRAIAEQSVALYRKVLHG